MATGFSVRARGELRPSLTPCSPSIRVLPFHTTNQVAAFSAGFLTFARVALPLRAGVAFALAPALNKYVIRPLVARGVLEDKE